MHGYRRTSRTTSHCSYRHIRLCSGQRYEGRHIFSIYSLKMIKLVSRLHVDNWHRRLPELIGNSKKAAITTKSWRIRLAFSRS
ncbi:hypothetical protein COOONC_04244 [Cooperia oncophora]